MDIKFTNSILDEPTGSVGIDALRGVAYNSLDALFHGNIDMTGWVTWPNEITDELKNDIKGAAKDICTKSDRLVVIGIGGSFLGAKAVIDMLGASSGLNKVATEVTFIGYSFSTRMMNELLEKLEHEDFSILAISKSGGTAETVSTFSVLRKALIDKYGDEEAAARTYMILGDKSGNDDSYLRKVSEEWHVKTFSMPEDIGGRYSVFTTVGLLPIAVAGIDIDELLDGARHAADKAEYQNGGLDYAIARNRVYAAGKKIEVFEFFDPYLDMLGEWLKQLFGESEGKDGKGIFPTSLVFTRDLHSMGQFLQEGDPSFTETVISFGSDDAKNVVIPDDAPAPFAGQTLDDINAAAKAGVIKAHASRGTMITEISVLSPDPFNVGYLLYWFMVECAVSALISGVDPFNQPGVEAYKCEMREAL